jgi:hypothetical protein
MHMDCTGDGYRNNSAWVQKEFLDHSDMSIEDWRNLAIERYTLIHKEAVIAGQFRVRSKPRSGSIA